MNWWKILRRKWNTWELWWDGRGGNLMKFVCGIEEVWREIALEWLSSLESKDMDEKSLMEIEEKLRRWKATKLSASSWKQSRYNSSDQEDSFMFAWFDWTLERFWSWLEASQSSVVVSESCWESSLVVDLHWAALGEVEVKMDVLDLDIVSEEVTADSLGFKFNRLWALLKAQFLLKAKIVGRHSSTFKDILPWNPFKLSVKSISHSTL
jgi:hypothetical protein